MKVIVERFGGFAGIRRRGERDGNELSPEQRAALQTLMEGRETATPSDVGADRFTYRVEVQDETGTKRVTVSESSLPRSLAEIVTN